MARTRCGRNESPSTQGEQEVPRLDAPGKDHEDYLQSHG